MSRDTKALALLAFGAGVLACYQLHRRQKAQSRYRDFRPWKAD